MKEEWREVPGFSTYLVSNKGRVAHIRILEPNVRTGYLSTTLLPDEVGTPKQRKGRRRSVRMFVHRLVLLAFRHASDENARHLDGNRQHNNLENLDYGGHKANAEDARAHGTLAIGSKVGGSKLTETQAREIIARYEVGNGRKLAYEYGVSREHVWAVATGRFWKHLHHGRGSR